MNAPRPRLDQRDLAEAERIVAAVASAFSAKVVGQNELRESLLVSLLAGGHLLIESVPGLAKTTAARVIAESIQGGFRRIQCTPDLLPSEGSHRHHFRHRPRRRRPHPRRRSPAVRPPIRIRSCG